KRQAGRNKASAARNLMEVKVPLGGRSARGQKVSKPTEFGRVDGTWRGGVNRTRSPACVIHTNSRSPMPIRSDFLRVASALSLSAMLVPAQSNLTIEPAQ